MEKQKKSSQRFHCVDALRGVALMGIALAHMVRQFIAVQPSDAMLSRMYPAQIDWYVDALMMWCIRGKFYAIFSILFGLSFFIQMDNAAKKGINYNFRFSWRLFLLFVFGLLHQLFYCGDILVVYAILGFALILFKKVENEVVLGLSCFLIIGGARLIVFGIFGKLPHLDSVVGIDEIYMNAVLSGSLYDVWIAGFERLIDKFNYQFGIGGRAFLTFGFFLFGMWTGRTRLIENLQDNRSRLKRISIAFLLCTLAIFPAIYYLESRLPEFIASSSWAVHLIGSAKDIFSTVFAIFLASSIIYFFSLPKLRFLQRLFAPYGRMALTNYIMQSLIGTFILYGWGLGLLGEIRSLYAFGIGILIVLFQMVVSYFWLKRFKYGPLEWLWRTLTLLKVQPIVKTPVKQMGHP